MIELLEFILLLEDESVCDPQTDNICNDVLAWGNQAIGQAGQIGNGQIYTSRFNPQNPFVQELGISTAPVLLFVDSATQKTLVVLKGGQITKANVQNAIATINGIQNNGDGTYSGDGFELGESDTLSLIPGFGLININMKYFKWLFLGVAAYSGYRATKSDSMIGSGLWGALAYAAGTTFYHNR